MKREDVKREEMTSLSRFASSRFTRMTTHARATKLNTALTARRLSRAARRFAYDEAMADSTAAKATHPEASYKETIESILVAFILAFVFRAFVVEAFVIPTGSMAPTL